MDLYRFYEEFDSKAELGMIIDIKEFFNEERNIKNYTISLDETGKIMIKVKLNEFSRGNAKKLFVNFFEYIEYCENIVLRKERKEEIQYFYLTMDKDVSAKMEIFIS